jgi:hypothetical protein
MYSSGVDAAVVAVKGTPIEEMPGVVVLLTTTSKLQCLSSVR